MPPHSNANDDDEDIDFSDLREQHEVRLDEGLDTFVVVDGCPVVSEENKPRLIKFLCKKLGEAGRTKPDAVFMPVNEESGMTEGYAFVEYETPEQALLAIKTLHGVALDKKHTMSINKLTDIDHFGRAGRISDTYTPPHIESFAETEHLRSWLSDANARDQFAMYRGDSVGVFWNRKKDTPDADVDRLGWTESFVQWSPQGTFLTSVHEQGVQLWGGPTWKRVMRFAHPAVNLVDFSPCERYLVTWSNKPISLPEMLPAGFPLGPDEEGKSFIVWDIKTGGLLRSFAAILDNPEDDLIEVVRKKVSWPVFKWSADDRYVARVVPGQSIQVFETPSMVLLGKKAIKIDGVVDFEWSPQAAAVPTPKDPKDKDPTTTTTPSTQTLAFWTPEMNNQTARVTLMSLPSKEIIRTRNLVNVSDCKLHWQSSGKYLCVKVDRHTKTKKSTFTSLEFFRLREKNIPVEIIELKASIVNFAWEPANGDRFVFITADDAVPGAAAVAPKMAVHFYAPEKIKGGGAGAVGEFTLVKTVERKNSNAIYWCPKGRFVLVATVHSQMSFELEFWDCDFEGEKMKLEGGKAGKEVAANLMLMGTGEHYGVTDVEWDPTGRYVATSTSMWKTPMENGYHLWDFRGALLREEHIDKFKQLLWRPRPPTLLTPSAQKAIRKNLREYSKAFDEEDLFESEAANKEVVEARMRMLDEWRAWRERVVAEVRMQRGVEEAVVVEEDRVVEEIVEEVVEEREELVVG
ncbi:uncharacterized protein H6S33_005197 [Morchella sextelata]|uniref:uncharacterized protein n=1 Tax=Morchella sextelata TaxID=1174677 RepID=UPI001D03A1E9|nr:uncharacterized protein H6S33_005197 [Morchella sextelata]KAH0605215.1 hypothetical protein H6S33_005197 [Morchella sextelata]